MKRLPSCPVSLMFISMFVLVFTFTNGCSDADTTALQVESLERVGSSDGVENLDEMMIRKERMATSTWGPDLMESQANSYIWQPETLSYKDVKTGTEVWRMSNTPGVINMYHNDISVHVWSADGKRMAFATDRDTNAYNRYKGRPWFIVNTNGSLLRPVIDGPSQTYRHTPYFHWSPQIPDVYYEFARGYGSKKSDLYKATVFDKKIISDLLISFPSNQSNELKLDKTVSADGRKILALTYDEKWIYPATIYPDNVAGLDLPDGYSVDRNMDSSWGNTPDVITSLHDQYYPADGTWQFEMPSKSNSWWRLKVLGSASDGGSVYSFTPPDIFDEQWPENVTDKSGVRDPFGSSYWSHFTVDRWGRYALHSCCCGKICWEKSPGSGPGVWDIQNHKYIVATFGGGAQHHDWSGFTDYIISSKGPSRKLAYSDDRIYVAKYNDALSQKTVVYTHTRYNNNGKRKGQYYTLTRPSQSPDGTKVAFHSSFLSKDDLGVDVYWAVAYYPYPPADLSAIYDGGVILEWLPPKYTERGWPYASSNPEKDDLLWPIVDEKGNELGEPLYAREIKRYHIWRSETGNSDWREIGDVNANYSHTYASDDDMIMLHPVVNGMKVSPTNKITYLDNPGSGTFYYAVTAEEHSGLESRELSEILMVTVSSDTLNQVNVVHAKGQENFWREPPPAPYPNEIKIPAGGEYRLTWDEPDDHMVRYYNIYYSSYGKPRVDQRFRIASIPVGVSTYLDWLADKSQPGYYRVTSVDRQGNESSE